MSELASKPLFNSLVITLGHMSVFPGELRLSCACAEHPPLEQNSLIWGQYNMSVQLRNYYICLRSEFTCHGLSVFPSIVQKPVKEHLKCVFYSGTLIKYVSV